MKTVLLIRDGAGIWPEIERRLRGANARVLSLTPEEAVAGVGGARPGLVILGEGQQRRLHVALARCAKLIVHPGGAPGVRVVEGARPGLAHIGWPLPEETFLEITARMLRLAERRTFRTLIRLLRTRTRESLMGQSENFSLTGMAFRADQELGPGEPVVVSFHMPGGAGRVSLLVEVTRVATDPTDGVPYYGGRFVGLEAQARAMVERFVYEGRE